MQHLTVADKERIAKSIAPEAILAGLDDARAEKRRLESRIAWLEKLLVRRCREVAAGTWPPKPASKEG